MIVVQIFFLVALLYIIFLLSYSLIYGAPFASIGKNKLQTMLELLDLKKGKFVDIGAGDGRIVIAAAKKGADAYGLEINPLIALYANANIKKHKVKKAKILLTDYWKYDTSPFDYVAVWGTKHMMGRLESKLLKELKKGARVVSNHNKFPNWKPTKVKNEVYLYLRS
jgi:protein-L-isoaspartate O-methyltransferase